MKLQDVFTASLVTCCTYPAYAELIPLTETQLDTVVGQVGIDITIGLDLLIDEIAYVDTDPDGGELILQDVFINNNDNEFTTSLDIIENEQGDLDLLSIAISPISDLDFVFGNIVIGSAESIGLGGFAILNLETPENNLEIDFNGEQQFSITGVIQASFDIVYFDDEQSTVDVDVDTGVPGTLILQGVSFGEGLFLNDVVVTQGEGSIRFDFNDVVASLQVQAIRIGTSNIGALAVDDIRLNNSFLTITEI